MSTKMGSCYYHSEKRAIATCAQCGVGICKECSVKDDLGRIICYSCGNEKLRQEHKECRKKRGRRFEEGKEFIIPGIIGILIVAVAIALIYYISPGRFKSVNWLYPYEVFEFIIAYGIIAYIFFSIPFGVIMLNDIFAPKYETIHGHFSKIYLKIMFAFIFGWIAFTFYWIRFVIHKVAELF